jgi:hypothetical protein
MSTLVGNGVEALAGLVRSVRGERVMLDADLAQLYGVETKFLKRAVNRNIERFPNDFVFLLSNQEVAILRCQIGTSSLQWGGTRYASMAFTEQGGGDAFKCVTIGSSGKSEHSHHADVCAAPEVDGFEPGVGSKDCRYGGKI